MPNLYAWDFHGTLEKGNEQNVRNICQSVLEQFGYYRKVTLDEVIYLYGRSWGSYFKALVPSLQQETVDKMVEEAVKMSAKISHKNIAPMDYALDVLLLLKLRGHDNIVVSNSRAYRLAAFVESVGITPLLRGVYGIESAKERDEKFDPVDFKAAQIMRAANGYEKVFMIGDSETDIEAGLLAGATSILFNPRKKQVETKAHRTITDLRDVLTL
ncbi:MAG: HAD hydrolase-like protein [Candidatus Aenigmatarchaeota archaeon]